jgi:hypothetical protein
MGEHPSTRAGGLSTSPEMISFVLFALLTLFAGALLPGFYVVFLVILEVDGLATLANSDALVSVDRSVYFLALLILSVGEPTVSLFSLFLEIVLVVAALDFSFLLRRLRNTTFDLSVITGRLESYGYTALPALLVSYSLTTLYSVASGGSVPDPLAFLALSSTTAIFAIYVVSRYLSSRELPGSR